MWLMPGTIYKIHSASVDTWRKCNFEEIQKIWLHRLQKINITFNINSVHDHRYQFYWWRKHTYLVKTIDIPEVTYRQLYHLRLYRVHLIITGSDSYIISVIWLHKNNIIYSLCFKQVWSFWETSFLFISKQSYVL